MIRTPSARIGAPSPVSVPALTQSLLRRFRAQRPLRGGSLLVTIFGDAIAPRGGVASLASLIRLGTCFGLTERLVRTSVARLAQDGWLVARRDGRLSEYRLADSGAQRFAEATQRIYGESPAWDGQWTLVLLPQLAARQRERLREELRWLGFGQIRPGAFAHPNSTLDQARTWIGNLGAEHCVVVRGASTGADAEQEIVAAGWDLLELTRWYRKFVATYEPLEAIIGAPLLQRRQARAALDVESAFVIRTLLIHDYRKIHLRDPLLPAGLLPADWVGTRAYGLCAGLYAGVFTAAEEFLSQAASTLENALPDATADTYARFGGLGLKDSA